ncbi:hypothetical protein G7Z17_g5599 [Cylindrodendrum hubeiense]|uniref:Uncharacterized protein n=1 Tax=Cylindrodendrum hubeiense TaxID=595255 RepID=A0A9P5HDV7_9HYPO|nr:hypothetical protein G7Z17_g5599 [Cylindrodendrum hubeiense]
MGFLSFLTRKSTGDRFSGRSIKTQAYDSTVASHPPVRGTYPVAGNGQNALDKLQQAARKRSVAQLPVIIPSTVDTFDNFDTYTAPSPQIPRNRDSLVGRPMSAPDGPKFNLRSKSVSRSSRGTSPAVVLRPDNDYIQKQLLPVISPVSPVPPVPIIPNQHRRRRSSLDSTNRFIDILDAQGEFKPSNFRSRVEASGAREYGEDVADRNIGINSHDLGSPAVQAFYSRSSHGGSNHGGSNHGDYIDHSSLVPSVPKPAHSNTSERSVRIRSRKKDATSLAKTADVSAWNSFSECHEVDMLRPEYPEYPRGRRIERRADLYYANPANQTYPITGDRRKSFHTFAPPSTERSRPRPLSVHPSLSNFDDDESYPPPLPRSRPKTSGGRSAVHGIGNLEVDSVMDEALDEPAPFPSMRAVPMPRAKANPVTGVPGRSSHTRRRSRSESFDWQAQSKHREPTLAISRPSSSSSIDPPRPRTGSLGGTSLQQRHRLDDITEHIPVRTSSLGLNSQPCFTPTTISSVYSSNAFTQPRSQHTPSTSIDASMGALSEKLGYERDLSPSVPSGGNLTPAYYTAAEEDLTLDALIVPRNKAHNQPRFDYVQDIPISESPLMSNYMSGFTDDSDVDSFIGTRGRAIGEEELLFNEGIYTATGGLPGLYDSFPSQKAPAPAPAPAPPPAPSSNPRSMRPTPVSSPKPVQKKRQDSSRPRSVHTRPRSRSHRSFESRHEFTIDAGDLDAFLQLQHEFLRSAGPMMASSFGADDRYGRLSMYEFDDDDDKVDIRTATRIRKDLHRGDTVRSLRSRRSRSTYRRRREEESGHAADIED